MVDFSNVFSCFCFCTQQDLEFKPNSANKQEVLCAEVLQAETHYSISFAGDNLLEISQSFTDILRNSPQIHYGNVIDDMYVLLKVRVLTGF